MTLTKSISILSLAVVTTIGTLVMTSSSYGVPTTPDRNRPGWIQGFVVSSDGKAMSGVSVEITALGDRKGTITKKTDASGTFKVGDLAPGRYIVKAFDRAEGEATIRCEVTTGHMTRIKLVLGKR